MGKYLVDGHLACAEIDGLLQRSLVKGRILGSDLRKQDRARLLKAKETLEALCSNTETLKEDSEKIVERLRDEPLEDKKLFALISPEAKMKYLNPFTQQAFFLVPNYHRVLDGASENFGKHIDTANTLLKGFYKE